MSLISGPSRVAGALLLAAALVAAATLPAAGAAELVVAAPQAVRAPAGTGEAAAATTAADRRARLARLRVSLAEYLATRDTVATVAFHDSVTDTTFTYAPRRRVTTASVAKLDILLALLLKHERSHTSMPAAERRLVVAMIERSDNAAATILYERVGGATGLAKANERFGLRSTTPAPGSWSLTSTSAADQVRLLRQLTSPDSRLTLAHRRYGLRLMRAVIATQHWGVSVSTDEGTTAAVKNGWVPRSTDDHRWVVNSVGVVKVEGRTVQVAVLTRSNSTMAEGVATIEHVSRMVRKTVLAIR